MIAAQRMEYIISLLQERNVVTTIDLSTMLKVSDMTIRRDLDELEQMGLCKRTHGGAVLAGRSIIQETSYRERELQNVREKQAIAHAALRKIEEGDTIALDSGTTTLYLAKLLREKANITVITNSIHAILALYCCKGVTVISTSGSISRPCLVGDEERDPCLVGSMAEETMNKFRPTKAFIGTSSLSIADGLSNSVLEEASMKRTMIGVSAEVFVLADHTKFGHTASFIVGPISLIDTLITDPGIPKKFEEEIKKMGVEVIKTHVD